MILHPNICMHTPNHAYPRGSFLIPSTLLCRSFHIHSWPSGDWMGRCQEELTCQGVTSTLFPVGTAPGVLLNLKCTQKVHKTVCDCSTVHRSYQCFGSTKVLLVSLSEHQHHWFSNFLLFLCIYGYEFPSKYCFSYSPQILVFHTFIITFQIFSYFHCDFLFDLNVILKHVV